MIFETSIVRNDKDQILLVSREYEIFALRLFDTSYKNRKEYI